MASLYDSSRTRRLRSRIYPTEPGGRAITATITDIVDSTASAVALGDRRWREIRNAHHDVIRRGLGSILWYEVDTSGDGFFAHIRTTRTTHCLVHALISDEVRAVGIDIRIGLHADGAERHMSYLEFLFKAVVSRVSSLATAGEILSLARWQRS